MTDIAPDKTGPFTPEEVAGELRVDVRTVQRLMKEGDLKFVAITKKLRRITRRQLDAYLAELESKAV